MYPVADRILQFSEGQTATLFCHGTDKRPNSISLASLDLSGTNPEYMELLCQNGQFLFADKVVSKTNLDRVTCIRIMEPVLERELQSDCSNGFGADLAQNGADITLVKVGWNLKGHFHEQV